MPPLPAPVRTLQRGWQTAVASAAFLLCVATSGAAQQADADGVVLVHREDETVLLGVRPINDEYIGLILTSQTPSCRFPEDLFELPIQVNGTGFQLKRAIRPEQKRDGALCTEAIATSYRPQHYWPLKTATAVTLHLPWGPLPLGEDALAHLKTLKPARAAEKAPADRDSYFNAINRLAEMLSAGQARQAREAAEVLLPSFATRPPDEGFAFFATLGTARRMIGELGPAASSFEVATMLAPMAKAGSNVGVVYDNLATVRRLQKRWPEAEEASDRAIAALETVDDPQARQALAGVYNNRALMKFQQEQYESAVAYSEKALAILRVTLKNRPKELEPFLEDNRTFREKLDRR